MASELTHLLFFEGGLPPIFSLLLYLLLTGASVVIYAFLKGLGTHTAKMIVERWFSED